MKKTLPLALLLIAACTNEPTPVDFTIYPAKNSYPGANNEAPPAPAGSKPIPATAYYNRGDPENLLDISTEMVTLSLDSRGSLKELAYRIAKDAPERATLNCSPAESRCMQARETLVQKGVEVQFGESTTDEVVLMYDVVAARDCENRYVDNLNEKHSLPAPTFGCSVMANTVQQVGDKRQFTRPALTDFQDADKAVQTYERYRLPPPPPKQDDGSLLDKLTTSR